MQQHFQALLNSRLVFETYTQHYHNKNDGTSVSLALGEILEVTK